MSFTNLDYSSEKFDLRSMEFGWKRLKSGSLFMLILI